MAECRVPSEVIRFLKLPAVQKINVFFGDLIETIYS